MGDSHHKRVDDTFPIMTFDHVEEALSWCKSHLDAQA